MSDPIDRESFAHLVELASFEFESGQADYLRDQLNKQLKSINELAAIPLSDDIPPARHGIPYPPENCPAIRDDHPEPFKEREDLIGQFPQFEDGYVIVPDIPHQTLE